MRKTNPSKSVQNPTKFLSEKTHKKTGISRTMEWLEIPKKTQAKFAKSFINIDIDYIQYTCYNIKQPLQNLYNVLGFTGQIDLDNSNIEYNHNLNLSLTHTDTRMGHAYMITFLSPGFAPIPIASVEVYNPNKKGVIKSEGKIVFYGAYFVFRQIIAEEAPEMIRFANTFEIANLVQIQKDEKPVYKRTRVDIALDIRDKISQKWLYKYIKPHKNSKQVTKPYNFTPELGGFQSFGYIPNISKSIGIRVYNKILDIKAKNKQSWYPNYGNEVNPEVTRMEIIYGGEFATDTLDNLMNYTKYRLLGDQNTKLKTKNRPKSQYSPISAYEYFKRYAKNHGKTLKQVLDDVTSILITEEEKDKFEAIDIYMN